MGPDDILEFIFRHYVAILLFLCVCAVIKAIADVRTRLLTRRKLGSDLAAAPSRPPGR